MKYREAFYMKPFKTKSKVFLIIFIFLIVWIFWSNTTLSISKYIISDESVPSEFNGFKMCIRDSYNIVRICSRKNFYSLFFIRFYIMQLNQNIHWFHILKRYVGAYGRQQFGCGYTACLLYTSRCV